MRPGMIEFIALEIDFRPAEMIGQALSKIERARTTDIITQENVQSFLEARIGLGILIGLLQRQDVGHQGFSNKATAKLAKAALRVGIRTPGITCVHLV